MITKEERTILRLAGILWIYEESIKNDKKLKTKRKIKDIFKR